MFSYFLIFFSCISAYIVINGYKYLNLIYISNRIKKQAVFDPSTGLYSWRYFLLLLGEKVKQRQNLVFVGLRITNFDKLSKDLNFDQIKTLINLLNKDLISRVQKSFRKAFISCLSTDTLGIIIEREQKKKIEKFTIDFIEEVPRNGWKIEDKEISCSLKGCLIIKPNRKLCINADPVFQMERLFNKIKSDDIITENITENVNEKGKASKISYKNVLDFIAYDWEEKNKDLERNIEEILKINTRLEKLNRGTLLALARAIDAKSSWTAGHSERVTKLALKMASILGLTQKEMNTLHQAGLLHDIGKIGIPVSILDKPGKLTVEEYGIIREHPGKGVKILQPIEEYTEVIPVAMQHHEWYNGQGYPDRLSGEEISFGARILAVADVFDALTSDRPYRVGMPIEQAISIIKKGSGTQFDPKVVEAFLELLEDKSLEKHVLQSDQPPVNIESIHAL
jgi:putative nucleotidyltransferase with HDIG domain